MVQADSLVDRWNSQLANCEPDELGEDPWSDLWFYSNPVFVRPVLHIGKRPAKELKPTS